MEQLHRIDPWRTDSSGGLKESHVIAKTVELQRHRRARHPVYQPVKAFNLNPVVAKKAADIRVRQARCHGIAVNWQRERQPGIAGAGNGRHSVPQGNAPHLAHADRIVPLCQHVPLLACANPRQITSRCRAASAIKRAPTNTPNWRFSPQQRHLGENSVTQPCLSLPSRPKRRSGNGRCESYP